MLELMQEQQQYLTFMLGQEMFAANILSIKEIIEYGQLTEVPMMPGFVRGVINLRGQVVPVIDLQARFGRAETEVRRRTCIIIVEIFSDAGHQHFGILVDAVNEVMDIPIEGIESPPSFGVQLKSSFMHGLGQVNGRFIVILNIDQVLLAEEMTALQELEGIQETETTVM